MASTSVSVAPRTGVDGYGKPNYGADASYRAHIARKRTLVRTDMGEQVESGQAIYVMSPVVILPTARLTLSTADTGSTEDTAVHPVILSVERRSDESGPHHVVLYL